MTKICRDERGSTMAAVLMVLMVVSVISVASIQLAQHSNDVSSVDRERFQAVSAAEAGVTSAIGRIESGGGCDATATAFADLTSGSDVIGRYRTRIDPESGTTCGQTPRRVIHSWGFAPTGGTRGLRHLEVTVELKANAGFPYTLFAQGTNGTIYVKNNGTINGDAYSTVLDQSKNNLFANNVVTPGSVVTQNNAVYTGTVWAGGNITIAQNSNIGQSVIAAGSTGPGNISLGNNTIIGGDARAKGTVSLGSGASVQGSVSQNNPNLPPPPVLSKPTFNPSAITYTLTGTAAQITTALNTNKNNLQGQFRATDGGTVVFPTDVKVSGPLTIVAAKVSMGRTMNASGGPHTVVVVATSTAADAIDIPQSLTIASALHTLLFTEGGVDLKSNVTMTGAIYANSIDMKNTFTINASEILKTLAPAGFTWNFGTSSTYSPVPTLWREIVPGVPPA